MRICGSNSWPAHISIHAPREGGDPVRICGSNSWPAHISIHAPREGGDLFRLRGICGLLLFQSTPPARGATPRIPFLEYLGVFQSTPPARGATVMSWTTAEAMGISIHAPREGGDCWQMTGRRRKEVFQSTPPARGATGANTWRGWSCGNFNPRPPRGGRR